MRRTIWLMAASAVLMAPTAGWSQWRTPWSYDMGRPDGPARWGDLDPDYGACKTGQAQSPINIRRVRKAALPPLDFAFHEGPVRLINNGYTAVRVDYAPGNGEALTIAGRRYELTQFHFHHPSEETLKGQRFAMNLHLMLKGEDGQVVGVVVFVKPGVANPTIAQLWAYMPEAKGPAQDLPGVTVDPGRLLPETLGYYRYTGSISAPPCSEGVDWYVLKAPIEASPAQIAAFARLYPHDVRPLQPLNGREVLESR